MLRSAYGKRFRVLPEVSIVVSARDKVPDIAIYSTIEFTPGEDQTRPIASAADARMSTQLAARRASGQAVSTSRPCVPTPSVVRSVRNVRVNSTAPGFEKTFFGEDFGARDPTPGEIGSNFGEKIVMNWDTEHIIKPPDAISKHVGLTSRQCSADNELLDETLRERYRQQVPGWRIQANKDSLQCIRHEWTAKDAEAAQQLVTKLSEVAQQQGHSLTHVDAVGTMVIAELTTAAKGGLTENDFIVAAHINDLDVSDLLQKRKARFWA